MSKDPIKHMQEELERSLAAMAAQNAKTIAAEVAVIVTQVMNQQASRCILTWSWATCPQAVQGYIQDQEDILWVAYVPFEYPHPKWIRDGSPFGRRVESISFPDGSKIWVGRG